MIAPPLIDRFGRVHRYLRLSVTDRCNFSCTYCVPPDGVKWSPKSAILSFEELARISRVFVSLGIEMIRLTGGEPTARAGIVHKRQTAVEKCLFDPVAFLTCLKPLPPVSPPTHTARTRLDTSTYASAVPLLCML